MMPWFPQESSDTLSLLISCERKLGAMLDIINKASSTSQTLDEGSFFITSPSPVSSGAAHGLPSVIMVGGCL